jgi:hypothetical protein
MPHQSRVSAQLPKRAPNGPPPAELVHLLLAVGGALRRAEWTHHAVEPALGAPAHAFDTGIGFGPLEQGRLGEAPQRLHDYQVIELPSVHGRSPRPTRPVIREFTVGTKIADVPHGVAEISAGSSVDGDARACLLSGRPATSHAMTPHPAMAISTGHRRNAPMAPSTCAMKVKTANTRTASTTRAWVPRKPGNSLALHRMPAATSGPTDTARRIQPKRYVLMLMPPRAEVRSKRRPGCHAQAAARQRVR